MNVLNDQYELWKIIKGVDVYAAAGLQHLAGSMYSVTSFVHRRSTG